jgi:nitrate reductase gamma subunit
VNLNHMYRVIAIPCICLSLACILLWTAPCVVLAVDERTLEGENEQGTVAFHVPEENLTIFEIAPRLYHRKGETLVRATGKDCRECHVSQYYPQDDFFGWEYRKKWTLHWWMFSLAMFIMIPGIYSTVSLWRRGRSPSLHHPVHWPSVMRATARDVILGERVRRQSGLRWAVFQLISIAFLALAVVFVLIVVQRFLLPLLGVTADRAGLFLEFSADFLGGCILVGILLAIYRRIAGRGGHFKTEAEDIVVLLLLLGIVTTGFFLESCRLAVVDPQPRIWASFLGAAVASVLRTWDLPWTGIRFYIWIFHAGLVFAFFAYFPFSKLFHIVTSPVSIVATASEAHYKQRQ